VQRARAVLLNNEEPLDALRLPTLRLGRRREVALALVLAKRARAFLSRGDLRAPFVPVAPLGSTKQPDGRAQRRSDSRARKGGRRYERKLIRVERSHVPGGAVGPVGIVRELHRDAYVATFAFTATIDIDEHLAAA